MAKRKSDFFTLLLEVPPWVSVVLAVAAFMGLRWLLPALLGKTIVGKTLSALSMTISFWIAGFFVLVAAFVFARHHAARVTAARRIAFDTSDNLGIYEDSALDSSGRALEKSAIWSLQLLREMDWKRFEELSAALMRELGFRAEIISHGPDGGIDVKVYKSGSATPDALVQCKSWMDTQVGIKPIRELLGVMTHERTREGMFFTTNDFTNEAIEFAKANRIELVSGFRYLEIIGTLDANAQLRLLKVAMAGDYRTPSCPTCGAKLKLRKRVPNEFWVCGNSPRCRYTLNRKMQSREAQ